MAEEHGRMDHDNTHEIELYLLEVFNTLLEHEVRKCRRYKYPLSLLCIAIECEPETPENRHAAELIVIHALDVELRDTDVPCREERDFLVLLPSTDEFGAHNACQRLERALNTTGQTTTGAAFHVSAFIGLASIGDDLVLSPKKLIENARSAMNHARANRSFTTMLFSSMK
jgi:PleD family two-component response regulator